MKKIVPFTKEIDFKTMISKITGISLEHTLCVGEDNKISGHFILEGTYKMTQASQIDEEFSYKIPVEIQIDDKYDVSNVILDIDDFTYRVIDDEKLSLDISVCIDHLEEKEEVVNIADDFEKIIFTDELEDRNDEVLDNLFLDDSKEKKLEINPDNDKEFEYDNKNVIIQNNLDVDNQLQSFKTNEKNDDIKLTKDNINGGMESLFSSFKDNTETYKTYFVYVVKEEDTIDSILDKYGVSREMVEEYNNLSEITVGSKIIIPSKKND